MKTEEYVPTNGSLTERLLASTNLDEFLNTCVGWSVRSTRVDSQGRKSSHFNIQFLGPGPLPPYCELGYSSSVIHPADSPLPYNNGRVIRHIFQLVQSEKDIDRLIVLDQFHEYFTNLGFTIPLTVFAQKRSTAAELKAKLLWYPPGQQPEA